MDYPKRKSLRLKDYDYSRNGAYFVTICSYDRHCIFGDPVGTATGRPLLSENGRITQAAIKNIDAIYPAVRVDKFVIMPNHVHLIIVLSGDGGRPMAAPTISRVINQFKGYVSKQMGFPIWQRSYYEHIIRNEQDYLSVWEYIDANPAKWAEDEYYNE